MDDPQNAPGLKSRPRKSGPPASYWCATSAAIEAGYPVKSVRLHGDKAANATRCVRLQAEMLLWLGKSTDAPAFDGTWRALFRFYETDPESTYNTGLKASSRHPYSVYLRKLTAHIGGRRISECDGRDVRRWFDIWAGGPVGTPGRKLGAARMALSVLKAALSWGIQCRFAGCAEFRAILAEMEFENLKSRTEAPTAAEIEATRRAAHAAGRPGRALAYALQFETVLRQWDIIGEWVALSDPRPSAVLAYGQKWVGLSWSNIGADLILRYTPGKTDDTSGARVLIDLRECPMALAELEKTPEAARSGPLIVNERTRLPYRYDAYRCGWRRDATASGLPARVWNRDIRAGGITEGRNANASKDDLKKVGGHTERSESAEIYDRAHLEAHRRVSRARKDYRERLNKPGT